jgi:ATP-dependent DNA ligase
LINLTEAAAVPVYTQSMFPRRMRPIRLSNLLQPFDSDQFIFELKIDGFRALAHIEASKPRVETT